MSRYWRYHSSCGFTQNLLSEMGKLECATSCTIKILTEREWYEEKKRILKQMDSWKVKKEHDERTWWMNGYKKSVSSWKKEASSFDTLSLSLSRVWGSRQEPGFSVVEFKHTSMSDSETDRQTLIECKHHNMVFLASCHFGNAWLSLQQNWREKLQPVSSAFARLIL